MALTMQPRYRKNHEMCKVNAPHLAIFAEFVKFLAAFFVSSNPLNSWNYVFRLFLSSELLQIVGAFFRLTLLFALDRLSNLFYYIGIGKSSDISRIQCV